jgi:hypothetical protein
MREGLIQVELLNARGDSAIYWIPAAPEVRPGLKLRLCETGSEEWTVRQTFTTCPGVPPVPHRLGTPDPPSHGLPCDVPCDTFVVVTPKLAHAD